MFRRYIVVDRDGTLIEEKHYLSDPEQVELIPHIASGLRRMQELGWGLVMVTNQSGIGRGYFDRSRLEEIHARMVRLLAEEEVHLDGIYYCPHTPKAGCKCRKPLPGLLKQAARDLVFNPKESFVVGDKACDISLGANVGAITVLVRTGYGARSEVEGKINSDYVIDHLGEVAAIPESKLARIKRDGEM